jgi:hypothetical protein
MLETPHVALGVAIATKIPNPLISLPLAFGSHFILDMLPHWNPHLYTETKKFGHPTKNTTIIVIADATLSALLAILAAGISLPNTAHAFWVLVAAGLSIAPDLAEGPYFFFKMRSKTIEKWIKLQRSIQNDVGFLLGVSTQIVMVLFCIFLIFS